MNNVATNEFSIAVGHNCRVHASRAIAIGSDIEIEEKAAGAIVIGRDFRGVLNPGDIVFSSGASNTLVFRSDGRICRGRRRITGDVLITEALRAFLRRTIIAVAK